MKPTSGTDSEVLPAAVAREILTAFFYLSDWLFDDLYPVSIWRLSRDVNKALDEGKLACQNRSCTVNNIFVATSEYPAANFRVKFSDNYLL